MAERTGVITFKGGPLTLIGPEIKVGDTAPNFKLLNSSLQEVTLDNFKGKTLIISVAPSLDTPVCSLQTQRFNKEIPQLPAGVEVITVSADLPFAQARFCGAEGIKMMTLSDHRDMAAWSGNGCEIPSHDASAHQPDRRFPQADWPCRDGHGRDEDRAARQLQNAHAPDRVRQAGTAGSQD